MMKKILILLCFICSIFLFTACKSSQCVEFPKVYFPIEFESKYNLNEDINVKISIGLNKDDQEYYSELKDFKYNLGYTPMDQNSHDIFFGDETVILYTITDFSNDIFYYTYIEDEIHFNFTEIFTIKKEIFNQDSGVFYIFMGDVGFTMSTRIIYQKKDGNLYLQEKYKGGFYEE